MTLPAWLRPTSEWTTEAQEAFALEGATTNQSRLRPLLPVMAVVHLLHVWAFSVSAAERVTLAPGLVHWREAVVGVHEVTAVAVGLCAAGVWLLPRQSMGWFAPLVGMVYLLHGAAIGAADQLHQAMVTPYMAYAVVVALILALEPLAGLALYAVGAVAITLALFGFQDDPEIRRSIVMHGPSISVAAAALTIFFQRTRARDFAQRGLIATQRAELEAWNAELEARVDEQVQESIARTREVENLNVQLQAQVRDRSQALAAALSRVASEQTPAVAGDGRLLADRFELRRHLGSGGMGAVYEGFDRATRSAVAVKLLRPDLRAPDLLQRFLREVEAVASLRDPGIVRMLHVDIDEDGTFFQIQELVAGETLLALLRREGTLQTPVVAGLIAGVARALATAHAAGIVHRDVKPANVMITPTSPGVKLLDFGVARMRQALTELEQTTGGATGPQTQVGAVVGTPGYMAPEQRLGQEVSPKSDIYALGVMTVLALSGRPPDTDPTWVDTVPPAFALIVASCLSLDPDERPTAAGLAEQLRPWSGEPTTGGSSPMDEETVFPDDLS